VREPMERIGECYAALGVGAPGKGMGGGTVRGKLSVSKRVGLVATSGGAAGISCEQTMGGRGGENRGEK